MNRKILSVFLMLCFMFTFCPAVLRAEEQIVYRPTFSEATDIIKSISNRSSEKNIIFIYGYMEYSSNFIDYAKLNNTEVYYYSYNPEAGSGENGSGISEIFNFFPGSGITFPVTVTYNGSTRAFKAISGTKLEDFKLQIQETGLDKEASDTLQPFYSENIGQNDYSRYGKTIKSYLCENQMGGVSRVEYFGNKVIVEDYSRLFALLSRKEIDSELPIWGGFFAGEKYNFLIFGQENPNENDNTEVIRVVKYSKNWERLGHASLNGANTVVPFGSGSLRCTEYGRMLYIRTSHKMYKSTDGLNHQSNLMIQINENDMTILDSFYKVMNVGYGYVSHSFNQFIIVDKELNIVAADHGDAYPRAFVLGRYNKKAGENSFSSNGYSNCNVQTFQGAVGDNNTGASIGGLAELNNSYVTSYSYDGVAGSGGRDVYIAFTSKDNLNTNTEKLTSSQGASTPILVPKDLNEGYILWNGKSDGNLNKTLYYALYSDNGVSEIQTADAPLSDCQPIYYNGKIVWYVTENSAPKFYTLDDSGVNVITPSVDSKVWDYTINSVSMENQKINVNVKKNLETKGTLVAAAYSSDDKIIDFALQNIDKTGVFSFDINISDTSYIKAFILESTQTIKPISKCKLLKLYSK